MDNDSSKERTIMTKRSALIITLMLTLAMTTNAAAMGKVFFSPDKRLALEQRRLMDVIPEVTAATTSATAPPPEQIETITINGLVKRSSGKNTVWINGVPHTERERNIARVNPRDLSSAVISNVNNNSSPTIIRVGDGMNRSTKEPSTLLGPGTILVK
jgi:hypothetical protein